MRSVLFATAALCWACATPASSLEGAPADTTEARTDAEPLLGTWVLQVRRSSWSPRDVDYVLTVDRDEAGALVGAAAVDLVMVGRTVYPLDEAEVDGDELSMVLRSPHLGTE